MARYKVTLAYDGTLFQGSQRQGQARTVQSEVEAALRRVNWRGRTILMAGRTDSGVHASGQVISFDLEWKHPTDALRAALNAYLPEDISAREIQEVEEDFHPRFSALERRYRYRLFCDPLRDPLRERYAWRVWPPVNLDRMNQAADCMLGSHDFAAFGTPPRPGGSTTRVVTRAAWRCANDGLEFEIAANAFLYHMVRRTVYLLVQVGEDRLDVEGFGRAVLAAEPQIPGLAPAQGLTLYRVQYPDVESNGLDLEER